MKKILTLFLILLILVGCSNNKEPNKENDTNTNQNSENKEEQVSYSERVNNEFVSISFKTPKEWRKEETEEYTYFYYTDEDKDGFLMPTVNKFDFEIDNEHDLFIEGFTNNSSIENVKELDIPGINSKFDIKGETYIQQVDSVDYNVDIIFVFDDDNDSVYVFPFIYLESSKKYIAGEIGNIINSIEVIAEPIVENNEENEDKEEVIDNNSIRPEIKEAIDSFEVFIDEYCEFMKKYSEDSTSLTMLADYAKFMGKYADMTDKMDKLEEDFTDAELKYYTEVMLRCDQKLLETAQ